jgi:Ca2+-binding RTX toxin-like protein
MKTLVQLRSATAIRLAGSAMAVAAAAAILAGHGDAAPAPRAEEALHLQKEATLKPPKLEDGVLKIKGTSASDTIVLRQQDGQPGILQVDVGNDGSADFSFERNEIATIAVRPKSGDDVVRVDESKGVFTDVIPTTIDGGAGDDTIAGGKGIETLKGGSGDDSIDGNGGNDLALMGAGDDTFVWDPGDGSDVVEGQQGADTMVFNGASAATGDHVALSANGNRLKFFRLEGPITMDTAGVERVDFNALGGTDLVTVNDLSATDVTDVNVDLAGTLGGTTGDGAADRVVVNATDGEDTIDVSGDASGVALTGFAATVRVLHAEAANDRLDVNELTGTDSVDFSGLAGGVIKLFLDGLQVL